MKSTGIFRSVASALGGLGRRGTGVAGNAGNAREGGSIEAVSEKGLRGRDK